MPPRIRSLQIDTPSIQTEPKTTNAKPRQTGSRWPRRLLFATALTILFVAFLPNLIGWLGLHKSLLPWALGEQAKQIRIGQLQLGWWQPVVVRDVQFASKAEQPLLNVGEIQTSQTLLGFLTSTELGTVKITRPIVYVETRAVGSNWEDELNHWQASADSDSAKSSDLPRVTVQVVDAQVQFVDRDQQTLANFQKLNCELQTGGEAAINGALETEITSPVQTGTLEIKFRLDEGAKQIAINDLIVELTGSGVDLSACQPALLRLLGSHHLSGIWTGELACQIRQQGSTIESQIKHFQATDFEFASTTWLGSDRVQFNKCLASGNCSWLPTGVRAEQFQAEADFGRLRMDGDLSWQNLANLTNGQSPIWSPITINGQLDLKPLVDMLPQTLRLHPELQMESGRVTFDVASRNEAAINKWILNLDTANLSARRGADRLTWAQPLRMAAVIARSGNAWEISQLECDSDFLKVQGQANLQTGNFQATGNLRVLLQRLQQFLDLPDWQLDGQLDSMLTWKIEEGALSSTAESLPLSVTGRMNIQKPVVQIPGLMNWSSPEIQFNIVGQGIHHRTQGTRVDQANVGALLGTEQLSAQLTRPLVLSESIWPLQLKCELLGSAQAWHQHLHALVDLPEFQIAGTTTVQSQVTLDADKVVLTSLQYQLDQARWIGFGLDIVEPKISGTAELTYHFANSNCEISDSTVVCSALAARASPLQLTISDPIQLAGPIAFRGDLNRLLPWFGVGKSPDEIQYFGAIEGNVLLSSNAEAILIECSASIPEVVAANLQTPATGGNPAWVELLREPQVNLVGKIGLSHDYDRLTIGNVQSTSRSLTVQLQGKIAELSSRFNMDLKGTWQPDWQRVNGLLAAYSSNQVTLVGRQQQAFAIQGPLLSSQTTSTSVETSAIAFLPPELRVETQLAWEQGQVFLLPLGPASTQLSLQSGIAKVATGPIPFSGGEIQFSPTVDLNQKQWSIVHPAGTLAQQVTITPEICRDWLKYVAPLIADATSAQGKFTVATEGIQVPLEQLMNTTAVGNIQLSDVTIGAGPLAEKLIGTVMSVKKMLRPNDTGDSQDLTVWLRLADQSIPYRVENGRVHHDGLKIGAKEFVMTTTGSVGFDQSLSMTAEIPIPDSWIDGEKWLAGLKGQSLKIPIGGTVSRPTLDTQALQTFSRDLMQKLAANQLNQVVTENTQKLQDKVTGQVQQAQEKLQDKFQTEVKDKFDNELKKGFDKLFGPKKDKE